MKSKICSSKYVKTVSKGKGWIPAFLTLGFLLAFPVADRQLEREQLYAGTDGTSL